MTLPNFTTQSAADYKANIDAFAAGRFYVHEQATPDMTALVDTGRLHNVDTDTLTVKVAQNTATITAPSTNPRYDIVYIDETTATVGVATGAEAASPSDPAIPTGKIPLARISLATSTTTITDAIITNLTPDHLTGFLKPDGDGSSLLNVGGASETDMRLAFLMIAENAGDRLNMVDGIADPLMDETDIDTATSTNEIYDAAGDFYSGTPGSDVLITGGTVGGDMTGGGGNAAAVDGTTSQTNANSAQGAASDTVTQVGKDWGGAKTVTAWKVYASSENFIVGNSDAVTCTLQGADDSTNINDGTWTDIDSLGGLSGDATGLVVDRAVGSATPYEALRVKFTGNSGTGSGYYVCAEVEFYEASAPANMTLVSTAFTAASAPDTGRVHVQVKENETITVNTDLTAEISRDGGTTWTTATLVLQETLADGTKAYEDDDVTISGQPSGTSMKYRIKTLNAKDIEVHGVVLQWA